MADTFNICVRFNDPPKPNLQTPPTPPLSTTGLVPVAGPPVHLVAAVAFTFIDFNLTALTAALRTPGHQSTSK